MKKIFGKQLNFDSIIVRSTIEIVIPVFILVTMISVFFYQNTIKSIDTQILESNYSELASISDVYDKTFESVNYTLNYFSETNELRMFFAAENPYEANTFYNLNVDNILSDIKSHADYIHSVNAFVENTTGIYQTMSSKSERVDITKFDWYKNLSQSNISDGVYICPCAVDNNYPYLISFVKKVTINNNNNNNKCFFVISVELRELNNFVLNETPEKLYLVKDNKIIYNKYMENMMWDMKNDPYLKDIEIKKDNDSFLTNCDNGKYVVSVKKSHLYDWSYVYIKSVENNSAERNGKKVIAFVFIFCVISLGVFISIKYVTSIFYPIREIENSMKNKKVSDDAHLPKEIQNISNKIMDFASANEELRTELDNRLEILKKYQVYSLQAQINPHFMFNVLNTIYMQSISDYNTDRKTSVMLLKISKYLRYVLESENEVEEIETEIEYAKIYVDFLQDRYEKLVEINWNVDEDIMNFKILKLCLQPILENAVYHGISQKTTLDGVLDIMGKRENNKLILIVTDNGIGMTKEKLEELKNNFKIDKTMNSEHIGLNNINSRIKLLYGKDYGVEIESQYQKGTTVKLILPII